MAGRSPMGAALLSSWLGPLLVFTWSHLWDHGFNFFQSAGGLEYYRTLHKFLLLWERCFSLSILCGSALPPALRFSCNVLEV
jgi:hypothetical protein